MRKSFSLSAFLLFLILVAAPTNADVLNFNLDFLYGGTSPAGTSPWLTATFEDITTDQVRLTLDSANLTANENVASWYFNFNPIVPGIISFQISGPLSQVLIGQNGQTAGSASGFDIGLSFIQPFGANQSAIYRLVGGGLSASSFDFVNEGGDFFSAAQVLGIGANSSVAWIADSKSGPGPAPVSEPATMILLSFGMAGLTFFGRKKLFV
jgi:hypothetical protein